MTDIDWQWYPFRLLSVDDLYGLLKLRQDVFILEQACFYPDLDGQDQHSMHLLGRDAEGELVAYLRLIPCVIDGRETMLIGRVLTSDKVRGKGVGRDLMAEALRYLTQMHPGTAVQLAAQCYLQDFYASFNFIPISEPYDDDGIMHIDMRLEDD